LVREFHGLRARRAIVRNDDEDVDALGEQALDILDLPRVVAVRGLDENFRAEFVRAAEKHVAIALPALFFQGVHRESDPRFCWDGGSASRAVATREHEAGDEAEQAGKQDEGKAQFHRGGIRGKRKGVPEKRRARGLVEQTRAARGVRALRSDVSAGGWKVGFTAIPKADNFYLNAVANGTM
jgi:hypothetical protein